MRVAFYAPMKAPTHPLPSGDREMARRLIAAIERGGHRVRLASAFSSYDGRGNDERQRRLAAIGQRLATRLARHYGALSEGERPELWFTYHLYHKAPDYLGPIVSRALAIPYVVAEASHAPKRAAGPWARGHEAAASAIADADLVLGLNRDDEACARPLLAAPARCYRSLPPFLDERRFKRRPGAAGRRPSGQEREARILVVAMMREGDKLASYRLLGRALAALRDLSWQLIVVGDGPARAGVRAALAPLAGRTCWLGEQPAHRLPALYATADLCAWPAINEAYGLALLEAQAAGLPVVAGRGRGVPDVVADGLSGVLVPVGRVPAFAAAVRRLLTRPAVRRRLGAVAERRVRARHGIDLAAQRLSQALIAAGAEARR